MEITRFGGSLTTPYYKQEPDIEPVPEPQIEVVESPEPVEEEQVIEKPFSIDDIMVRAHWPLETKEHFDVDDEHKPFTNKGKKRR